MDKPRIEKILNRVRRVLESSDPESSEVNTIDDLDRVSYDLSRKIGKVVTDELKVELTDERASTKEECSCGRWARYKGVRPHLLVCRSGVVKIPRRYYYCRMCDAGFCPHDRSIGISGSCYPLMVQSQVARVSSLLPYSAAMSLLHDLSGVSVSPSHAQAVVEQAGRVASSYYAQQRQRALSEDTVVDARPNVLYLEADGVQTPIIGGWRETKIGVVFEDGSDGRSAPKRYVSHLGGSEEFGDAWYSQALLAGLHNAKRVVVLGDGAAWIWKQADLNFVGATQILDFWHASERLWRVARAAYADVGEQAVPAWVSQRQAQLRNSDLAGVFRALSELERSHPCAAAVVAETRTYYKNNRMRMDYASYEGQGLSIGSGAIESGCKQVVTQRLKGAGMRWTEEAAQAIAHLRCLQLSSMWEGFLELWRIKTIHKNSLTPCFAHS
jgi:hypothetical protein